MATAPSPGRPLPTSTPDSAWWWEALARQWLPIQRCAACQALRHPPGPACPACHSLDWDTVAACGRGVVYSLTVLHHPPLAGFTYPLVAAVIELEEGTRLVSNVVGVEPDDVRIGQPVRVEFFEVSDGAWLHRFRVQEAADVA